MQVLTHQQFAGRFADKDEFFNILSFLPTLSPKGPWVAGGAVRKLIERKPQDSDFDFFFASEDQFKDCLEWINRSAKIKVISTREAENNVQLSIQIPECEFPCKTYLIQLIKIDFYVDLAECLDSFDYTLCQAGYDGEKFLFGDLTLWDIGRKHLVVNKITYPVASLRRLLKYTSQGYYACGSCLEALLNSAAKQPELMENKSKYID